MRKVFNDIKWLMNYMMSILMYATTFTLVIVGIMILAYFVDFKISLNNTEAPLYGAYVIVSGSMEPIIRVKDAVLTKRVDPEDIAVGDVVTYRSTDSAYYGILVTHRVVNIKEENGETVYITKGDHNETVDRSAIKADQIYGKVIMRIPKIGYIKYFLVSSYGWIIVIIIPSLGIIIYDIMKIFKNYKALKQEKKVMILEK